MKEIHANGKYKDRLFNFIFGREENRKWTLSLYNAINNSHYDDPSLIHFNTLENVLYMGMRNDTSFLISGMVNVYEHQSSFNPNMPLRLLEYLTDLFSSYIDEYGYNKYSSTQIKLPTPKLVVFYNGSKEKEDEIILKLSNSFDESTRNESDVEVSVRMLNINHGRNNKIMQSCKPLKEYAWLIDNIREGQKSGMNILTAIDEAINIMPKDFEIRGFLEKNQAEVRGMLDTEYDEAKIRELFMADGRREGRAEEQANTERERKRAEAAEERLKQLEKEIELLKKQLSNK